MIVVTPFAVRPEWGAGHEEIPGSPIRAAVRINKFFGAVFRLPRRLFLSTLVHLRQKPASGLFKRFCLSVVAVFHERNIAKDRQHEVQKNSVNGAQSYE